MRRYRKSVLKNLRDVCNHFGVGYYVNDDERTNQGLTKTIRNYTECGAWARVERDVVSKVEECWTAAVRDSTAGPLVVSVRKRGSKKRTASETPGYVRSFLLMDGSDCVEWMTFEEIRSVMPGQYVRAVTENKGTVFITFVLERPVYGLVFKCGSIVEGSDVEITSTPIPLPCHPRDLEGALAYVNTEAIRVWHEVNEEPSLLKDLRGSR